MNNDSHPFLSKLAEIRDAESRIAMALSKMKKSDVSEELKMAILSHLKDTEGNITGVANIHEYFCGRAGQEYLESTAPQGDKRPQDSALSSSLKSINDTGPPTNGSQRAWETASYGALNEWDGLMNRVEAAHFLETILEDESNQASASGDWI